MTRWGRYKIFPIVGTALMTVGAYLLSLIDASTNGWVLAGYMFVFGVGMGLVMQVLVVAVQNAVSYQDLGVATSSATFFRMIGGSFGTAVFGAIYAIVLNHTIAPTLAKVPASILRNFNPQTINPGVLAQLKSTAAGLFFYTKYIDAVTHAIQIVFLVAVPIAFVAFLLSLLAPRGGVAQDRADGRRRRSERLARPPDVAAGDRAGVDPVVGPGEPGRAVPRRWPSGLASICRPVPVGCCTGWPTSRPARSNDVANRLKVAPDLIQPGVDGLLGGRHGRGAPAGCGVRSLSHDCRHDCAREAHRGAARPG